MINIETSKKNVAVIGASGMAGQQFIEALDGHPWFNIVSIHGSTKSIGKTYGETRKGISSHLTSPHILDMPITDIYDADINNIDIIFSAVPSTIANKMEAELAIQKPVISTASAYRYEPDIPIFLPFVNGIHYKLFDKQKADRGWKGFICPGPNCSTVGLAIATFPIFKKFGIKSIHVTTLQAISGSGYPGTPSYDILGNVIPYIPDEEEKIIKELKKIFGIIEEGKITAPDIMMDAKCNRVPVINGHMESVFIQTVKQTTVEEIQEILTNFKGETEGLNLPNAPEYPIRVFNDSEPYRPQPRVELKRCNDHSGMITYVGGISKTNFPNGFKFTVLSHNTELGAGRGGVLSAEYLVAKKYI
ncbi:aspartate-semialdehyde dehydrogenase [Candidatus Lokiarchaeum ossiferum]|uniref:aspartate-semialdehyde dehydrogenase n=1 Tax=Candidatus Lokiarchaeum ossiferum TaxID=2951803 RepID=UPI00352DD0C9